MPLYLLQFTLYSILKGNKPDFHSAMAGDQSEQFYQDFLAILKKDFKPELIKGENIWVARLACA